MEAQDKSVRVVYHSNGLLLEIGEALEPDDRGSSMFFEVEDDWVCREDAANRQCNHALSVGIAPDQDGPNATKKRTTWTLRISARQS